ncbi:hypothetical protein DB32_003190 [Sandaracinus amylolyticus]|uniref:Helix-turn-helix domain-containing protein n=1 Tax=Sandaracinus amylolyticus TaxID=927083 RepID=A0A0F6YIN7_9BACT|nr:hypothetical protein DB32_003190 [Sandaracinus amylolyticus]
MVIDADELERRIAAAVDEGVRRALEAREPANGAPAEWFDRKGAAELLGVHVDSLSRLGVPVHYVGARRVRYNRAELERWMREGRPSKGA